VERLLVSMGYGRSVTDVSKALVGGDGGVDGIIGQDPPRFGPYLCSCEALCGGQHRWLLGYSRFVDLFRSLDRYKATKGDSSQPQPSHRRHVKQPTNWVSGLRSLMVTRSRA
jgi:hypothetical protein